MSGKRLFVANRISSDIAVLDAQTGVEEKRLLLARRQLSCTLARWKPHLCDSCLPKIIPRQTGLENRLPPESEFTVIDAGRAVVVDRVQLHGIAGVFHVALSADGRLGVAAEYSPQDLVPAGARGTRWSFHLFARTVWPGCGQTPVEVPLDELERYARSLSASL